MFHFKIQKYDEEPNRAHVQRIKAGNDRIVKPDPTNQLFFHPKKGENKTPKKVRSRKKNVPSVKENNVHSVPESDAENENKNATVSCNIEQDDKFACDTTIDQRNITKHNADYVHQSSLLIETKLDYF